MEINHTKPFIKYTEAPKNLQSEILKITDIDAKTISTMNNLPYLLTRKKQKEKSK
jgi:hypothetical protein